MQSYTRRGYISGRELALLNKRRRKKAERYIKKHGWVQRNSDAMVSPQLIAKRG